MTITAQPLPFNEQIDYFRKKINMPTETYLDIYGEAHDYAFAVAGAHTHEIVGDFRQAVDEIIEGSGTLEDFRQRFDEIVEKHSWEYNGGRNWRSRIIYDTNLYSSYNHGRYEQQKALADVLPYWMYEHNDSQHPRIQHKGWHGKVLRANDPWWDLHYPVRAYGCHCTVRALDDVDLEMQGLKVENAPPIEWEERVIGKRSGNPRIVRVPKGVDPSFEHPKRFVPVHKVDEILLQKLVDNEPKTAALMGEAILRHEPAMKMLKQSFAEMVDKLDAGGYSQKIHKYVGVVPKEIIAKLGTLGKAPQTAVIAVRDEDIGHALRDLKRGKGINMPASFWRELPELLQKPKAILLQPKEMSRDPDAKNALLFIYDTEQGKIALKLDYDATIRDLHTGKKSKVKLNLVRTVSRLKDLTGTKHFPLLWGEL